MTNPKTATALRQVGLLSASGFGLWLLLVGPAWILVGVNGVVGLTVSAALCLMPGCVVLVWKAYLAPSLDLVFLVSTGVRFGLLAASALVVKVIAPEFGLREFYIWLVLFYLFALAIETWLVLRR